jgi:PPOX class probable F420-dependent enzyme
MIDLTTKPGARAAERLQNEQVLWLTTVTPAGQPQASPVWFLWTGSELVLASLDGTPRTANIRSNPRVAVHFDSDGEGGDVVSMEGEARIDESSPSDAEKDAYFSKYDAKISAYSWTPESMFRDYPVIIRIRPTRLRAW